MLHSMLYSILIFYCVPLCMEPVALLPLHAHARVRRNACVRRIRICSGGFGVQGLKVCKASTRAQSTPHLRPSLRGVLRHPLGFGSRIWGLGSQVSGFWFLVSGFGFLVSGFGAWDSDSTCQGMPVIGGTVAAAASRLSPSPPPSCSYCCASALHPDRRSGFSSVEPQRLHPCFTFPSLGFRAPGFGFRTMGDGCGV
jgi:hypothetical protein